MVSMDFDGNVLRFNNRFPEEKRVSKLSREEAQVLAENALAEYLGMNISAVTLTSAQESQKPNRLDWTFTFTDNNELEYEVQSFKILSPYQEIRYLDSQSLFLFLKSG